MNTVLVTRSGAAGTRLLERLRAAGWMAVDACPLRLDEPENPAQLLASFKRVLPCDRIIFTSAEGVRQAVQLFGVDDLSACPVIVPGPGTREVALTLGLRKIICPDAVGNSEAMLALPALGQVAKKRVLILAAAGGRQTLASELSKRGASVHSLHVYRRLPRQISAQALQALDRADRPVCLLASAGALLGLRQQLTAEQWQKLQGASMVAPSPRVAEMATKLGCRQVVLAGGADDAAMMEAMQRCCSPR